MQLDIFFSSSQAAWRQHCYKSDADLKQKKGPNKSFKHFADDLTSAADRNAQLLGALCKVVHNMTCDADLHKKHVDNEGNCVILYCRAAVFACHFYIHLMDLQPSTLSSNDKVRLRCSACQENFQSLTVAGTNMLAQIPSFIGFHKWLNVLF